MAEIHLTLVDDQGHSTERVFALDGKLDTLDQIEQAVEHFKQQALPEVEKSLLTRAQERFVEQEKKNVAGKQR